MTARRYLQRCASLLGLLLLVWACGGSVHSGRSEGEAGEAGQTEDLAGTAGSAGTATLSGAAGAANNGGTAGANAGEGGNSNVSGQAGTAGTESSAGAAGSTASNVTIKQLATFGPDTCALLSNGTIKCWGYNECGQLGVSANSKPWSVEPITVPDISDAIWVSIGYRFACAVLQDHTVKCWGCNDFGQLGDGTMKDSAVPVQVQGLSGAVQVVAQSSTHGCALLDDGTVACWPAGIVPLNDLEPMAPDTSVALVPGISSAIQFAGDGYASMCVLLKDHTVACRGSNDLGQLGNGTTDPSDVPVVVPGLVDVAQVSGNSAFYCAVIADGTVECWGGFYRYGCQDELGCQQSTLTPTVVTGLPPAVQVAAASGACAVLADATVRCWGDNPYGQLGNGTTTYSETPVVVEGLSGVQQVVRSNASCALLEDGTARCWGRNAYGTLGDGTSNDSLVPVMVTAAP